MAIWLPSLSRPRHAVWLSCTLSLFVACSDRVAVPIDQAEHESEPGDGHDSDAGRGPDAGPTAPEPPLLRDGGSADPETLPGRTGCGPEGLTLTTGWKLQSSALAGAQGADISRPGFATEGWHDATVPATVLSALVADGTYPDPRVRDNLDRIPRAPFDGTWWYRYELDVPASFAGQAVELGLEGVSYRANVWLNGERIADGSQVVGTFVHHRLDVTGRLRAGERNVLAIEVTRPDPLRDLAITFHDWSPDTPDKGMGLWRRVTLERTGPVALRGAYVVTNLSDDLTSAQLSVVAEVSNTTDQVVRMPLRVEFEGQTLEREVELAAHESTEVRFEPDAYPALALTAPRVWWPKDMGEQPLYELCVTAGSAEAPSDQEPVRFGIREATSEIDANGHRLLRMNGKPFWVKGAGWTSDMLLEFKSKERLDAELGYFLDLGLNTLRMEGKFEDQAFHDRADELGIMTLPGWMCCDRWEQWVINAEWQDFEVWGPEEPIVAVKSTRSAAETFRNHPSAIGFFLSSDWAPPDAIADAYQEALRSHGFQGSIFPSATHYETHDLKSGFKMTGPYDWVPPHYWFFPHNGGNFGFITESSPGPSIPELDTLRAMLTPAEQDALWRNTAAPQLHAGGRGSDFESMAGLGDALRERHGAATSLEDFVQKAQLLNYEGQRVPFEAYRQNKYTRSTGFVQWLFNTAWPSLIWNLFSHDLATHASYFGAKKALEPVHIQYAYDSRSVRVLNDTHAEQTGLSARVRVYDADSALRFEHESELSVGADGSSTVVTIPQLTGLTSSYFVSLGLTRAGVHVASNLYWLSTRADGLDWAATDWRRTPPSAFADFRALNTLAPVTLVTSAVTSTEGDERVTRVVLENQTQKLAFFVRLELHAGRGGEQVVPARWSDNYLSLEPGERREVTVRYRATLLSGQTPAVLIQGQNVARQDIDG